MSVWDHLVDDTVNFLIFWNPWLYDAIDAHFSLREYSTYFLQVSEN